MKTKLMCGAVGALVLAGGPALAGPSSGPAYVPDLLPPSSNAGQCYARVEIPARYETVSQDVMTAAPYATTRVTQPKFQARQEQVMVKEPSVRYEVRQPTFRTVTEQIVTRPAYDKLSVSPPQFSTMSETLKMSEPQLVWKRGNPGELRRQGYIIHSTADAGRNGAGYSSTTQYGTSGGANCGSDCEIWCLVEEPGIQQTFQRRVMSNPGGVQRTRVPARTQTVSKQVVADRGGVREVPVPGQFRTVTVEDLVDAGREYSENTPPQYGRVQGKVLVEPARYEWRQVVCKPGTAGYSSSYGNSHTSAHTGSQHSGSGHFGSGYAGSAYGGSTHSGSAYGGGQSGTTHSGIYNSTSGYDSMAGGYDAGTTTTYGTDTYSQGQYGTSAPAYGNSGSINDQLNRKSMQRRGY